MDKPAGPGARADDGAAPGKPAKRKNASKIITLRERKDMLYAGLDVRKSSIQAAVLDGDGKILTNRKIPHTPESVRDMAGHLPKQTKYVMESSSVWEGTYRLMTEEMKLDVTLSNPRTTLLIAKSKKKTDRVDAVVLADMHRGGYIAACYVADIKTMGERELVRHRDKTVNRRTSCKNSIHGILLQLNFQTRATSFSTPWIYQVRGLKNYRINDQLTLIETLNTLIRKLDRRVDEAVGNNEYTKLIRTIPGFGNFSALVVASMIGDIDRFNSPESFCSYCGVVPSVRSSANKTYYGPITHTGDSLLRRILVECTMVHLRYAPADSYIVRFYNRIEKKRGKNKARVAAASKMLRVIFHMLKENRAWKP